MKEKMNTAYLLGRLTAVVEAVCDVPADFPAKCNVNPKAKLLPLVLAAAKMESKLDDEIQSIMEDIPADYDYPSTMEAVDAGRMWVGYYHEKNKLNNADDRTRIGKQVAELRQARGLTQEQLSSVIDMDRGYIGAVELGLRSTGVEVLSRIAAALGARLNIIDKSISNEGNRG